MYTFTLSDHSSLPQISANDDGKRVTFTGKGLRQRSVEAIFNGERITIGLLLSTANILLSFLPHSHIFAIEVRAKGFVTSLRFQKLSSIMRKLWLRWNILQNIFMTSSFNRKVK
jgi:hypothetical protein